MLTTFTCYAHDTLNIAFDVDVNLVPEMFAAFAVGDFVYDGNDCYEVVRVAAPRALVVKYVRSVGDTAQADVPVCG